MSFIVVLFLFIQIITSSKCDLTIVNGTAVDIKERPYQVSLNRYNEDKSVKCCCGGVIISKDYVLTSAHCIQPETTYFIRAGSSACNSSGELYDINTKFNHLKLTWEPDNYNGLAILKMAKEIIFSDSVQPIKMAEKGFDATNLDVEISGYGNLCDKKKDCPKNSQLLKIELQTLTKEECLRVKPNILIDVLCHIDKKYYRSTPCQGDSGGPVTLTRDAQVTLLGVVIANHECWTNMSSYSSYIPVFRDWIKSITNL